MTRKIKMKTYKIVFILSLHSVYLASGYPSKPLNERSPSLTWEAWLLIDEQHKQLLNSDGILQKQITPKSIFVAPNFSPEYLPVCAVGSSQCIKMIKLDQDAHYEFLIERLKQKYNHVDYEDYYDEDYSSTAGPLQLNIPLYINSERMEKEEEIREENKIAIILSPTEKQFDRNILNLYKRDNKNDKHQQKLYLKSIPYSTAGKVEQIHPSIDDEVTTAESDTEKSVSLSNMKLLNFKMKDAAHSVKTSLATTRAGPTLPTAESATKLELSTSTSKPYIWPNITLRSNLWRLPGDTNVRLPNIQVKYSDTSNIRSHTPFGRNFHAKYPYIFEQSTFNDKKYNPGTTTRQILPRKGMRYQG